MPDMSLSVMSLLMALGLFLVALKPVPRRTGIAFLYAGSAILCAHPIGVKIVAPIGETTAETVSWITVFLMVGMIVFSAGRGLVRTARRDRPAPSQVAN